MEIRNTHILVCVIRFQSLLSVVYLWLHVDASYLCLIFKKRIQLVIRLYTVQCSKRRHVQTLYAPLKRLWIIQTLWLSI